MNAYHVELETTKGKFLVYEEGYTEQMARTSAVECIKKKPHIFGNFLRITSVSCLGKVTYS